MMFYELRFAQDHLGDSKKITFKASGASEAINLARQEAENRSAELWLDSHKLCTIHSGRIADDA